jgi:hypothetical protein
MQHLRARHAMSAHDSRARLVHAQQALKKALCTSYCMKGVQQIVLNDLLSSLQSPHFTVQKWTLACR